MQGVCVGALVATVCRVSALRPAWGPTAMTWRLGVDIGGTFTDFALFDERGYEIAVLKRLTTPTDPSIAVIEGTAALLRREDVPMAVDPGLIPVFDTTGRANLGHALETAVHVELERRRLDVTYVRTPQGHEVDFLARGPERRPEFIRVCADLSDAAVVDRELRALEAAGERFPDAGKRLLTLDRDNLPGTLPDGVVAETAYEWMLNEGAPS